MVLAEGVPTVPYCLSYVVSIIKAKEGIFGRKKGTNVRKKH